MSEYLPPGHAPLKFHPLANLFPMLSDAELEILSADIAANGQAETVKLHHGMILDGRNRYLGCALRNLGVRCEVFRGTDQEALDFVISKNVHRRHLDSSQRAYAMACYEKLSHGGSRKPKPLDQDANLHLDLASEPVAEVATRAELAERGKVSERSIASGAVVRDQGAPELQDAVKEGHIAVSAAAEIAERPVEEQKAILESLPRDAKGKLTPEAKKALAPVMKEVRAEKQAEKKAKRNDREAELGRRILALPDVKAGLIVSDYEWHFKVRSAETGMDRHAANHYVTAKEANTPEEIVERQRERMSIAADDCIHLMWCPASFNAVALKVMELQGFTYVSQFAWIKPSIGTGFWVRDKHELLLIGVKGKIPCPAMGDQFESAIEAPKGAHSEKPDFQYEIAEGYFPNLPKVELNARRHREGWIQWGNEAPEPEQPTLGIESGEEAA